MRNNGAPSGPALPSGRRTHYNMNGHSVDQHQHQVHHLHLLPGSSGGVAGTSTRGGATRSTAGQRIPQPRTSGGQQPSISSSGAAIGGTSCTRGHHQTAPRGVATSVGAGNNYVYAGGSSSVTTSATSSIFGSSLPGKQNYNLNHHQQLHGRAGPRNSMPSTAGVEGTTSSANNFSTGNPGPRTHEEVARQAADPSSSTSTLNIRKFSGGKKRTSYNNPQVHPSSTNAAPSSSASSNTGASNYLNNSNAYPAAPAAGAPGSEIAGTTADAFCGHRTSSLPGDPEQCNMAGQSSGATSSTRAGNNINTMQQQHQHDVQSRIEGTIKERNFKTTRTATSQEEHHKNVGPSSTNSNIKNKHPPKTSTSEEPEVEGADVSFATQARLAYDYCIEHLEYTQAIWYAERMIAEYKELDDPQRAARAAEAHYLLALAYYRKRDITQAYFCLVQHLASADADVVRQDAKFLLARCSFDLGYFDQAEEALEAAGIGTHLCRPAPRASEDDDSQPQLPSNAAAGLHLLGQVKERQGARDKAIEAYRKCVELAPFMLQAYERLSWLSLGMATSGGTNSAAALMGGPSASSRTLSSSETPLVSSLKNESKHGRANNIQRQHQREYKSFTTCSALLPGPTSDPEDETASSSAPASRGAAGRVASSRRYRDSISVGDLLNVIARAVHASHDFDTKKTLQILSSLPRRHFETAFVLDLVARCHFEQADYRRAEQVYRQVRRLEPRRLEGLEQYSTCLWHLRKDVECGQLAHQCLQWDPLRQSPQTWCVIGNAFSQQKEHDTAIKFFKRAIQIDPHFTYAYTLCAHEFVANEKLDKAVPHYERALSIDPRHYNAWWGLGNIYYRQEEYENARYHFLKAMEINRSNSVLRCYLGMVLESLSNPIMALEYFDRATKTESKTHAASRQQNAMAYFQKACVLVGLDRYEEALVDLEIVRNLAPKEACVHFQIGKVYCKLGQEKKALKEFMIAMDLNKDSKDYHVIKGHIERLQVGGPEDVLMAASAGDEVDAENLDNSGQENLLRCAVPEHLEEEDEDVSMDDEEQDVVSHQFGHIGGPVSSHQFSHGAGSAGHPHQPPADEIEALQQYYLETIGPGPPGAAGQVDVGPAPDNQHVNKNFGVPGAGPSREVDQQHFDDRRTPALVGSFNFPHGTSQMSSSFPGMSSSFPQVRSSSSSSSSQDEDHLLSRRRPAGQQQAEGQQHLLHSGFISGASTSSSSRVDDVAPRGIVAARPGAVVAPRSIAAGAATNTNPNPYLRRLERGGGPTSSSSSSSISACVGPGRGVVSTTGVGESHLHTVGGGGTGSSSSGGTRRSPVIISSGSSLPPPPGGPPGR